MQDGMQLLEQRFQTCDVSASDATQHQGRGCITRRLETISETFRALLLVPKGDLWDLFS